MIPCCRKLCCVVLGLVCFLVTWLLWILRPILSPYIYALPSVADEPSRPIYQLEAVARDGQSTTGVPRIGEVPLLFHQIFLNYTPMPTTWPRNIESCKSRTTEFRYVLWDRRKVERFLHESFPWFMNTYRSYPYDVQRADAARYFIMYTFGGLYMDMDLVCRKPLEGLVRQMLNGQPAAPECMFSQADPDGVIGIDVIVCKPRSEIMRQATTHLEVFNRFYGLPYLTVILGTGPLFLTTVQMFNSNPNRSIAIISQRGSEHYFEYGLGRTWHGWDGKLLNWLYYNLAQDFRDHSRQIITHVTVAVLMAALFCLLYIQIRRTWVYFLRSMTS